MTIDKEKNKEEAIRLLMSTQRTGMDTVVKELEGLGYFSAPASASHHLNVEGGLAEHSLKVCKMALMLRAQLIKENPDLEERLPKDSVIIASLLHDVCKSEVYVKTVKNRKNALGRWEEYETYGVCYEPFPLGHGEKSVIRLLRWGLDLSDDEIMAIRWHMGPWELPFQSPESRNNFKAAQEQCPLQSVLYAADGLSAHILET